MTYEELDKAADRAAGAILLKAGPRAEPVIVSSPTGIPMVVAILAVLKLGKFYVPLDPGAPRTSNLSLLRGFNDPFVVTDNDGLAAARALSAPEGRVLVLDELLAHLPPAAPRAPISPDSLAYIYFTSGSTGLPKGVMDTHRNVLHNVMRYTNSLHISPNDRLSLIQAPMFSGIVSSLFGGLLNGATVCLYDLAAKGLDGLAEWIRREGVTIYHSVPAFFRHLAAEDGEWPSVRLVRLEGDQASRADLEVFQKRFPAECILVNGLGATECGLVRQFFFDARSALPEGPVPVGYAVEDMEVHLVNAEAASGVILGEIAVRSRFLSPGYWERPDLTAVRFVMNDDDGARTYLTGDVGRMGRDGCLAHLGRQDFQRKVRGQWVDASQVEAALLKQTDILAAVSTLHEDRFGEPRIVAYIVTTGSRPISSRDLRQFLRGSLPEHMIPSLIMTIDSIPLTAAGKVDRAALPPPDWRREREARPFVAPRTPTERILADLWASLLGLDRVGVDEDFHDLGGHSLLAMRVAALIMRNLGVKIPVKRMLEAPTVMELARAVDEERSRERPLKLDDLLSEIESLSDEEVARFVRDDDLQAEAP